MQDIPELLLREMAGMPPVFDPAEPIDPQIEAWKAWSYKMRMVWDAGKALEEGWYSETDAEKIT